MIKVRKKRKKSLSSRLKGKLRGGIGEDRYQYVIVAVLIAIVISYFLWHYIQGMGAGAPPE